MRASRSGSRRTALAFEGKGSLLLCDLVARAARRTRVATRRAGVATIAVQVRVGGVSARCSENGDGRKGGEEPGERGLEASRKRCVGVHALTSVLPAKCDFDGQRALQRFPHTPAPPSDLMHPPRHSRSVLHAPPSSWRTTHLPEMQRAPSEHSPVGHAPPGFPRTCGAHLPAAQPASAHCPPVRHDPPKGTSGAQRRRSQCPVHSGWALSS
jgi:hypothetical protein